MQGQISVYVNQPKQRPDPTNTGDRASDPQKLPAKRIADYVELLSAGKTLH
jgi:hypothetical protein